MAIYKIFPYKDSTLYSYYPSMNTGMDPILEISNINKSTNPQISRYLVEFVQSEIEEVIDQKIKTSEWDVNYRNYIATAQGLTEETKVEIYPIAQSWPNGTGTYLDSPIVTDGCNWFSGSVAWSSSGEDSFGNTVTGSFNTDYIPSGGGAWLINSGSTNFKVSQSFDIRSQKDINLSVKEVVSRWYSGSILNNGFITKWEDLVEFTTNTSIQPIMKFYSVDTNTIYPPQLEFKWRDYSSVLTGSATASIVDTTNIATALAENPGVFTPQSVNRFRFNVAPKYPKKVFQTSSFFTGTNYLPTASYYAIKDLETNEFVVNYDTSYTQLSSDSKGNYFDVYMNGLEPERYYKICVKTNIKGSTLILDDNYYFKVVNAL